MSCILSEFFDRTYLPIKKLEKQHLWKNNTNFIDASLTAGFIHSIYRELGETEYFEAVSRYIKNSKCTNTFILYANNLVFLLIITKQGEGGCDTVTFETWKELRSYSEHAISSVVVYTFDDEDVAYVVEPFCGKKLSNTSPYIDVSMRLISWGSVVDIDPQNRLFLGLRVATTPSLEPLQTRLRKKEQVTCPAEPAFASLLDTLTKSQYSYFALNRVISKSKDLYCDQTDIENILKERQLNDL